MVIKLILISHYRVLPIIHVVSPQLINFKIANQINCVSTTHNQAPQIKFTL